MVRWQPLKSILYSGKSDKDDHHEQGIGLILSIRANKSLMEWEPISAIIIITARFSSKWRDVTVIQCYAPTNSNKEETKEEFYEELQAVMDKVSNRDIIIVMEDMNA